MFEGVRACDEAWILQAALDAKRGSPQRFSIRSHQSGVSLSVYSPLPGWIMRAWDVLGTQVTVERGAGRSPLITYRFADDRIVGEQAALLEKSLWMTSL
jgi:hypothetical protein